MEINKAVNPHFENFIFDWDSKIYLLVGGYGSSKRYHIALKITLKLLQEKRTALVVREVYDTIRESCYSLFAEICYTLDLSHLIKFTRSPMNMIFSNGSKIIFRGLDNLELTACEFCRSLKFIRTKKLWQKLKNSSQI